jgi:hypothetical protein
MWEAAARVRTRGHSFAAFAAVLWLFAAGSADAQDFQLWGHFTLTRIESHQLTYGLDIEPKVLVAKPSDDPGWATLDVTPSIEYTRGQWVDVVGELLAARTNQTNDLNTTEITPRLGFRFHVLSNLRNDLVKERLSKRRLVVRDLLRLEWRNLYYSSGKPDSSSFRLRNRFEIEYPLNRRRIAENGAVYVLGDAEWFWTGEDLDERFASKERVRGGVGHRRSFPWRLEALYVWDRSRRTATDGFTTSASAAEVRVRRVW